MEEEELAGNASAIIELLKSKLPKREHNISTIIFKTTMGKPIKVEYGKGKAK